MDNKQINKDWTLREDRTPRKKDVVIDVNFSLGVVTKSEGEFGKKKIWVNDVTGYEMYTAESVDSFRIANREQTIDFFLKYKNNTGWNKGKIYTIKGQDYPLLLVDMTYDLMKQEMLYVFRDLNVPDLKHLKTTNESLVEKIPSWFDEVLVNSFCADIGSSLDHEVHISLHEKTTGSETWNVSGRSFSFKGRDAAEAEIEKWISRMRIRRVASVLCMAELIEPSMIAVSDDGFLHIVPAKMKCGQPAIFNSRVSAATALNFLGESTWMSALQSEVDEYDI